MSDQTEALIIAVLVIVCLMLLFQVEIYRNILALVGHYVQESPLPPELRFSSTFLAPHTNKHTIQS